MYSGQVDSWNLRDRHGVVYRPKTELQSHCFRAVLPVQFDEYVWFDETRAVRAFLAPTREGVPDTYPFGV